MVPPQSQVQAPVRSLDQRMEALKRANDIRVKRAQLKKDLKSGDASIEQILRDPPEFVSTAKVFDMLMAVPKFGRVKAARLLNQCGSARRRRSAVSPGASAPSSSSSSTTAPNLAAGVPSTRPVFVVTGPSGAGKGTLIRKLVERIPVLEVAVSATTRPQRPGEADGSEYWFLSDEEFQSRIDAGDFLEHVAYVSGRRYGTLRSEMGRIRRDGRV